MNKRPFIKTIVSSGTTALTAKFGAGLTFAAEATLSVPLLLCPGAKRAYDELGWWGKTKNYPPMAYPV